MPNPQTIIGREYPKAITPLIKAAKKSIDICVFDWRWYPDQIGSNIQKFNCAIIVAAHRGVRVRVLTPAEATVKILQDNGVNAKIWEGGKRMHAKLMVIDDEIAILGSHNYTASAFDLNHEVSTINFDRDLVVNFSSYFKDLWGL
jgi:phosphatidylserine/phosphatidylglycerophosphate/cardiolipin synthase-like enzyme